MICMLSGESARPLSTHPKISGLGSVGGLAMGDVLVGFDKDAFTSFGLDQAANAAMSDTAAQQYIDGLNDLIKNHSRRLAGAMVAHWFQDRVDDADDPFAYLYGFETDEQTAKSAQAEARRLLDSIRSGERADLGSNRYYAVTLSGAAGRVMVRDWMEGAFERLVGEKRVNALLRRAAATGVPLTYFEVATALAFLAFAQARVDVAVLETGRARFGPIWTLRLVGFAPLVSRASGAVTTASACNPRYPRAMSPATSACWSACAPRWRPCAPSSRSMGNKAQ